MEWYRRATEAGQARATTNLGWCYERGKGVEVNYDECFRLYTLAAQQDYPPLSAI